MNSSLEQNGPTGVITGRTLKIVISNETGILKHPFELIATMSTAFGMNPAENPVQSTTIESVPCPETIFPTDVHWYVYPKPKSVVV